ncbi:UrcA family protein [Litorimonas sp. WD9-15]|uniref:UrcA family protein n=1 Tax=Litorimonas sp. WD9-15 TaxID=3418716 RepID=UPI003CFDE44D
MLIKRNVNMLSQIGAVNNLGRALASAAIISTLALASTAHAGGEILVERVVTVKFNASELVAPNGVEDVYAKIEKKAIRVCKDDRATRYYTGETVSECTKDLLTQFIEAADIESLQAYHASKLSSKSEKFALN